MNRFQRTVANYFISHYDSRMSFPELMKHLEEESDLVIPFEPFISIQKETLIALMEDLLEELYNNFIPKNNLENDIKEALLRN
jgi:hypothetical protein